MNSLKRHHHFRADQIDKDDRIARLEQAIVELLLETDVPDEQRDSSIAWELKHQAGVAQCARILAAKRGLDLDVATAGALLHDIAVIVTGSYTNHARAGGPVASALLDRTGLYTPLELESILHVVTEHSDKHLVSNDDWIEFGKDVDILDCFLYPGALDEYILVKPLSIAHYYFARAKRVWAEMSMPIPTSFFSLDDALETEWMPIRFSGSVEEAFERVRNLCAGDNAAPFAVWNEAGERGAETITVATTRSAMRDRNRGTGTQMLRSDIENLFHSGESSETIIVWPAIAAIQSVSPGDELYSAVHSNAHGGQK